jgi:hypothetical protein
MGKRMLVSLSVMMMALALLVPGLLSPEKAQAQVMDWEQVSADGFGYATPSVMSSAISMVEYNGSLYAGTHDGPKGTGCAVWRYDGGTTWTQVSTNGFGNANNRTAFSMAVYNGLLYVGTANSTTGCEVWSYDSNDDSWEQEVGQGAAGSSTGPGFGDGINVGNASAMLVFEGNLYVGAGSSLAVVWAYDGADWTQINTDDFGVANNRDCRSLAVFMGDLYAGTYNTTTYCQVYRYDGPNPADWTQVNTNGFGSSQQDARVMQTYNNLLYVGTAGGDPEVWTYDNATWDNVTPTYPDTMNDAIRSMALYKNALYVGVGNYSGGTPLTNVGAQVYRYDKTGASEQVNLSGFDGDPQNMPCHSLCEFQGDLYAGVMNVDWGPSTELYYGAQVWRATFPSTWYLAEGCTEGGMETFALVQNPNPYAVTVDVDFMTTTGIVLGPQDFPVPANSRVSFNVNSLVTDWNVSTMVTPTGGDVICERSMYGNDRTWAHDSIGVTDPSDVWFLAEGSTDGGMETYVLVQNPNPVDTEVALAFLTSTGLAPGPENYPIPAFSRVTFKVNDYVTDYNVSTEVFSDDDVVCERSMYGNGRIWAHDSIGVTDPSDVWFLAEGSTDGGMETYVLVQNPMNFNVLVDVEFMTGTGYVPGPQDYSIPPLSRVTFKVNDYVTDYDVSTMVVGEFPVIAERSVYGNDRTWAHDSIGTASPEYVWYLPEGCTEGGMETFVLVQNPYTEPIGVNIDFMTSTGLVPGPQDVPIPALSRITFKVNDYVTDWNVSTKVTAIEGGVVCERSMYGNDRSWAHDSIGYAP